MNGAASTDKSSLKLFCAICARLVPAKRAKNKSFSAVTCSDECYLALRIMRRNLRRQKGWYVPKSKRAQFERWLAESTRVPPEPQQSSLDPLRTAQTIPGAID